MSYESAKGYKAEHAVQALLATIAPHCYRPRAGAKHDVGDVAGLPFVVSVKDHATLKLSEFTDQLVAQVRVAHVGTGVVWHKRRGRGDPRDWYVTTTGALAMPLLRAYLDMAGGWE